MSGSYLSGARRLAPLSVLLMFLMSALVLIGSSERVEAITLSEGEINGDVTWSTSDSPVIIEGNLTITEGSTLTISPGVIVNLADDIWMEVKGNLTAIGTGPSPVQFTGSGSNGFDRINITAGGIGILDHCTITANEGVGAIGSGSTLRLYNSTVVSSTGVFAYSGSEVWAINCSLSAQYNVDVSGGTLHEGNWFNFKAVRDIDGTPYMGAELKISATKPGTSDWDVYDSKAGDPTTGVDGRLPPIAVEEYLHSGSRSNARVNFTLKMTAENNRWSEAINDPPLHMGADIDLLWEMDFTPPETPVNLTVTGKGAHHINIKWEFNGNASEVKFFIINYKKWWESESEWDTEEPGPSSRDWNISSEIPANAVEGLLEELEYDIKLSCIDGSNNPSDVVGPIRVKTLDQTSPEVPVDISIEGRGGDWAEVQWNRSSSADVIGYEFFLRNEMGPSVFHSFVNSTLGVGEKTQTYNLTGLTNETAYRLVMRSVDDSEIPNYSNLTDELIFGTLDITPPVAPTLEIVFDDPSQFVEGSGYYNGTQIALRGNVEGENRSFIDVFVDDELYVNPNPDLPRPATFEGHFFFFMELGQGVHDIKVRSVDPGNNEGAFSDVESIQIDLSEPTIGLELPEDKMIETDNDWIMILPANASDDVGVHSAVWTITGPDGTEEITGDTLEHMFDEGNYTVLLTVYDLSGNHDSVLFKIRSRVPDDTVPVATVLQPTTYIDLDHAPVFIIQFSELVIWSQLEASVVDDPFSDGTIDLIATIDEENRTVEYLLTKALSGGKNYTFTINYIEDLRGNLGPTLGFSFRTIDDDRVDSDSDGIPDVYEVQKTFLSPSDPTDASEDEDGDGLTNVEEYNTGSDPELKDSDGDEMTDGWEVDNGFHPLDRSDALQDPDGDGYTNLEEFRANTDPLDAKDKPTPADGGGDPTMILLIVAAVIVLIVIIAVTLIILKKRSQEEKEQDVIEEAQETTETTWSEQEEANKGECPSCGATLEDGLDYCPECGANIPLEDGLDSGSLDIQEDDVMDEGSEVVEGQIEHTDIPGPEEVDDDLSYPPEADEGIEMNEPPSL